MLNILTALTQFLLDHEESTEESCDIPDENIEEWRQQVADEISALSENADKHSLRLEQLKLIQDHLQKVTSIRAKKCKS